MKKSLVLAMAMALGVTASAYAASPFSDVPAGHWAYDSIAKLAAACVIDGYGDTTFGGDKLMTRYEMAQITARAMAKGANVDKLAAEFADELDNLGVRVANLEKKADNVKINGQVRFRYKDYDSKSGNDTYMRTRLWVNGQVNDDWSYTAMLQNERYISDAKGSNTVYKDDDDAIKVKRAYIDGKLGGLDVTVGRWDEAPHTGNVLDVTADGVKVSYGDKVKVWGAAFKADDGEVLTNADERIYIAGVETKVGVVDTYATYYLAENNDKKEIYNLGLSFDVAKDLNLAYEYMLGNKKINDQVSKDGWVATLAYKGADAATPGTWGVKATYFDQPINAILYPTTDAKWDFDNESGYKGYGLVANYALAKNIVAELSYYDTEAKVGPEDEKLFYADLYFTF